MAAIVPVAHARKFRRDITAFIVFTCRRNLTSTSHARVRSNREDLPGGPARLHSLRPAHENPRLRERSTLHPENPRPPRPAAARAGRPPPAREVLRVAEAGEGWGVPASWD